MAEQIHTHVMCTVHVHVLLYCPVGYEMVALSPGQWLGKGGCVCVEGEVSLVGQISGPRD